jgi:hypothetical protein
MGVFRILTDILGCWALVGRFQLLVLVNIGKVLVEHIYVGISGGILVALKCNKLCLP